MSFSKREKILISILLLIIITIIYVNHFMLPQLDSIRELRSIIEQDTARLELNNSYKKKVEEVDTEIKILNQKLQNLKSEFPAALYYDELIILLRDLSQHAKFNIQNISFNEPKAVEEVVPQSTLSQSDFSILTNIRDEKLRQTIEQLGLNEDMDKVGKNKKVPIGKAYKQTLDISAKASNAALKNFFSNLEKLDIKVGINRISINNAFDGLLSVNFSLDFYGINDNTAQDVTILGENMWEPLESGVKNNIFAPFEGLSSNISSVEVWNGELQELDTEELLNELNSYNFLMNVVPFGNNMAPPTVSLALKGMVYESGKYLIPIVYGDNKDFEKVEVFVEEVEGRYYARFKTEHESFPDPGFKNTVEFTLRDDEIKMLIESTPRKFQDDTGGVSMSIINNTDKKFILNIRNDDKTSPRIKFDNLSDTVEINYE